jgi:hypothetical protein
MDAPPAWRRRCRCRSAPPGAPRARRLRNSRMRVRVRTSSLAQTPASFSSHQAKRFMACWRSCIVRGLHPCARPSASQRSTDLRRSWDAVGEGRREEAPGDGRADAREDPGGVALFLLARVALFGISRLLSRCEMEPAEQESCSDSCLEWETAHGRKRPTRDSNPRRTP